MGEQQAPVRRVCTSVGKAHAFRMPLDAQNGKACMHNGFCYAVKGLLDDDQAFAWLRNALMMGAVDREVFSIQGVEKASLFRIRGVDLIFSDVFVLSGGWQILNDASSQADVDQLHAFTDAEYGQFFFQEGAQEEKLKTVKSGINGAGALILLMKKKRINIAAAGKNESVVGVGWFRKENGERLSRIDQPLFRHCVVERPADGAQGGESGKIVLNLAGGTGNQKTWRGHFFSFFPFWPYCYNMPQMCL